MDKEEFKYILKLGDEGKLINGILGLANIRKIDKFEFEHPGYINILYLLSIIKNEYPSINVNMSISKDNTYNEDNI